MNVHGLIKYWLANTTVSALSWEPRISVLWRAPLVVQECRVSEEELSHLSKSVKKRIIRVLDLDASPFGPWAARAIGLAARTGRISLAMALMHTWVEALEPSPHLAARARHLLKVEVQMSRRLVQWQRQWPRQVMNYHDQPAWVIPALIKRLRMIGVNSAITVYSGGHILAPQPWVWQFPEDETNPESVSMGVVVNHELLLSAI